MNYMPKFQICPWRTSDGKCTHKHCDNKKSKKKRKCGYSKPKDCGMYDYWFKNNKSDDRALKHETDYNELRGDNEKI